MAESDRTPRHLVVAKCAAPDEVDDVVARLVESGVEPDHLAVVAREPHVVTARWGGRPSARSILVGGLAGLVIGALTVGVVAGFVIGVVAAAVSATVRPERALAAERYDVVARGRAAIDLAGRVLVRPASAG